MSGFGDGHSPPRVHAVRVVSRSISAPAPGDLSTVAQLPPDLRVWGQFFCAQIFRFEHKICHFFPLHFPKKPLDVVV